MASLILGVAGAALGPSLFGGGLSLLGATLSGAQIGGALGAFLGSEIDAAIAPGTRAARTGPRLSDTQIQASTEGAPIPRLYGRVRIAGQLIWATRFKETIVTSKIGGGKGLPQPSVREHDYRYSISFAVGLCAGATRLGRVWADGNLIDLSTYTTRFYAGGETQAADPLIAEIEGADNAPAYRGLSYIVFEDLPLAAFGNRIPQLHFEVIHNLSAANPDAVENRLRGVALIPGAGELVYATNVATNDDGNGTTAPENAHGASGRSDCEASLDELEALAPNLEAVSLVVGWFASDLRAGSCAIMPGVETATKTTYPDIWSVNGFARASAHLVSGIGGRPAYGGTPSDASVVAAIQDLKARGLRVQFCPFLFMDIPAGNMLADPYSSAALQAAYPWRGRITCSPAPGVAGSPDQTAAATAQIAAFFGNASTANFAVSGTSVTWSGGADFGYRRMILHYAKLCAAAGGVDAFLIGSELRGLTRVRDSATHYPAVAQLKTLAADVRAILGAQTKLGYAADWSEYNNHQTGGGGVLFNLDPLWSDPNIDFIGIDNYMPLADWRDGILHRDYDATNGPTSTHDRAYLEANIRGHEDYDWFYASSADRDAQIRTPISDGLGKPWVWRAKDLWNWWSNSHYDRPSGVESSTPTGWVAGGKPIRFTELGCPAVDKGANQPNDFVDAKSAESALPYYSNGERDDLIQRRCLEAHLAFWADGANNPAATHYAGRMVDTDNIYVWCWDARPFPFFPARADVWGDAANYTLGHWLNGRLGAVALPDLVGALCDAADFVARDTSALDGLVTGYGVTATTSVRDALTPLSVAFHFDAVESAGVIAFVGRGRSPAAGFGEADLVIAEGAANFGFELNRAQETDLPLASRILYIDADADYRQASVEARRLVSLSDRVAQSNLPIVMDQAQAAGIAERLLQDAWVMRESAKFALPPSALALDPADEVTLSAGGRSHRLRLTGIDDGQTRQIEAIATDPSLYEPLTGSSRTPGMLQTLASVGRALVVFLDLPLLTGAEKDWAPNVAAYAAPWPGSVQVLRSASTANYVLDVALNHPAAIGQTLADLPPAPPWRWDMTNNLVVRLTQGALASADDLTVLGGANVIAIQNASGDFEIVQFANAALTGPNQWTLSRLLRGQAGTENESGSFAGARVVLLDGSTAQLALLASEATLPFNYLWGPSSKAMSDPAFQGASRQFKANGRRPYAPCRLNAVYAANGVDLLLGWIRRDRSPSADSWEQTEVPLSETSESYDVEILAGAGAVVRTFSSLSAATCAYAATQIAADFPSGLPSPFRFTVYQLSTTYGRGPGTTASVLFT